MCFLCCVTTVWRVRLDAWEALTAERLGWLDAAERARAARFHASSLADRWRVAHIALRGVLADMVGMEPAALRFADDAQGKPALHPPSRLRFNLSHAADVALIAVHEGGEVGVDVEQIRPVSEMGGIAASHFSREEQAALWAASAEARLETFYRIWTRKEAFVKATGVGIGPALARFAVTADRARPRLLYALDTPDASSWNMYDVTVAAPYVSEPYVAALCVAGAPRPVVVRDWNAS